MTPRPHALACALLLAAAPLPAAAQFSGTRAPPPGLGQGAPARPPPPALPGLAGRTAPAPIPADPNAAALAPNAALFDAVNRGDLPAVREAVGRGADLEARNALGLTALDSAVDQGRPEILFFLLSARGPGRGAPAPREEAAAAPPSPPRGRAPRAPRPEPAASAPAGPSGPRLFAGDGGAPQPGIGFLGFDTGGASAAAPPEPGARPARRRAGTLSGRG